MDLSGPLSYWYTGLLRFFNLCSGNGPSLGNIPLNKSREKTQKTMELHLMFLCKRQSRYSSLRAGWAAFQCLEVKVVIECLKVSSWIPLSFEGLPGGACGSCDIGWFWCFSTCWDHVFAKKNMKHFPKIHPKSEKLENWYQGYHYYLAISSVVGSIGSPFSFFPWSMLFFGSWWWLPRSWGLLAYQFHNNSCCLLPWFWMFGVLLK